MNQWGRNNPVLIEKQCAYSLLMISVGLNVSVVWLKYYILIFTKLSVTSLVVKKLSKRNQNFKVRHKYLFLYYGTKGRINCDSREIGQ